jgi:hypothetical protein
VPVAGSPGPASPFEIRLQRCIAEGSGRLGNDARSHPPPFFRARHDAEFSGLVQPPLRC